MGRNLRLNIDIICLLLLEFRVQAINAQDNSQNPFVFTTIEYRRHYDESAPTNYILHQNYPNPFNRITTIRYEVSEFGPEDVTIYDILGKRIKTIASGDHSPGVY